MVSIFSRIYSYRQRENKNNKENYLIEIFAFCLEQDELFLTAFFNLLEIKNTDTPNIKTQVSDPELGRPDIELKNQKLHLLIEAKIEHQERDGQLDDYRKILNKSKPPEKHLVYLTKYYEDKNLKSEKIKFHPIRWFQIHDLITEENHPFTFQLKTYLKEEKMDSSKNFNYHDLTALQTINSSISKMDEVLNQVNDYFGKATNIQGLTKGAARSTAMAYWNCYRDYKTLTSADGYIFNIYIGYSLGWENDIRLYLEFQMPTSNSNKTAEEYQQWFLDNLEGMQKVDDGKYIYAGFYKSLTDFFSKKDHIKAMIDQFKEWIDQVAKLIKKHPEKFGLKP